MIDYLCILSMGEGFRHGIDLTFDNMQDWIGMLEITSKINSSLCNKL
jgi:hypothetical protein